MCSICVAWVYLSGIKDNDVGAIAEYLPEAKNLKTIKLSKNCIGDEGVRLLCGGL